MDDVSALQRTVRRCTAILVVAVGLHLGAVADASNNWSVVLFTGGWLYLVGSGFHEFVVEAGPDGETGGQNGDGPTPGEGSESD